MKDQKHLQTILQDIDGIIMQMVGYYTLKYSKPMTFFVPKIPAGNQTNSKEYGTGKRPVYAILEKNH
ncbi:MAG: hypothetical protein NVSMB7_02510 [Chitinophagaceae bacterium]